MLIYILILLSTFFFMEFTAWFTHKYVMHGLLWNLHFDHHNKQKGFFEKNDAFFLIFAVPSWLFIMFGMLDGFDIKMWIGFGILLYGFAYFLFHEVLIHRRFPKFRKFLFKNLDNKYLKAVQFAHKMHHSHLGKEDGESFGMLIIAPKYFKKVK